MSALRMAFAGPDIAGMALESNGGTFAVQFGKNGMRVTPAFLSGGWMVAFPYREEIVPIAEFDNKRIGEFIGKNLDIITEPGNYLGAWMNDGKVYLDVSQCFVKREDAIRASVQREQLAMWDNTNSVEIPID